MPPVRQKFLLIQTAFPGDVVLATALAERLHVSFPEARIDFLLRKGTESLLAGHPFLHHVWVWDKGKNKRFNLLKLALAVRREGYTHVINPHRFFTSGLITALSGAGERIGFDKNPLSRFYTRRLPHVISAPYTPEPVHEVARNQSLIAHLTSDTPALPRLYPTAADAAAVAPLQARPYFCISPASVWPTKQYPAERWAALIDALPAGHAVYLLGGPGDAPLGERIRTLAQRPGVTSLCGSLSFLQSAALLRGARMNWTNDSAPLHLCTAVDAPATAVFCSTVPAFGFGPLGPKGRVAEVPGQLYCRPCGLHGRKACPEGHFRCALDIPTETLLAGVPRPDPA